MKRGSLGILVFLIVALLVAFLLMKQMQSPTSLSDKVSEKAGEIATEAAEAAALEKEQHLQQAMLKIRQRYGKNSILHGTSYQEGATGRDRNQTIGGHKA